MTYNEFEEYVNERITPYNSTIWINSEDQIHARKMWDVMKIGNNWFTDGVMKIEVPVYGSITFKVKQ